MHPAVNRTGGKCFLIPAQHFLVCAMLQILQLTTQIIIERRLFVAHIFKGLGKIESFFILHFLLEFRPFAESSPIVIHPCQGVIIVLHQLGRNVFWLQRKQQVFSLTVEASCG